MSALENTQTWDVAVYARAKMKNLPENFMIYKFNWLGDLNDRENNVMEVTGAVFREAKSGPRKGKLCMMVKGTERKVFLTPDDVKAIDSTRENDAR